MSLGGALRKLEREYGEIVARHERARDMSMFTKYASDPVGFITEVLGGEPWQRQVEIAEAVKRSPLVVVRSCNAAGKDWIAAQLALWWVYSRGGLVLLTGPTERQVVEIVMGEVTRAFFRARELPGEMYRTALRLGRTENAGILAFTSTEASRLTGFHAPRILAILTEAQGVEDFAWEGLLACATGPDDRVLAVGNPLAPSGRFYAVSRSRSWEAIRISAFEHPNLRNDTTPIPGGPSRPFIERIASEFGSDSGIYQSRVEGEFPDEGEEGLFRRTWLEAAFDRHRQETTGPTDDLAGTIVAVDPARYGPDQTAVAIARGPRINRVVTWARRDLMETAGLLVEMLRKAGVTPIGSHEDERSRQLAGEAWLAGRSWYSGLAPKGVVLVDEVGVGAGLLDRLSELGYEVEGFNGGASSTFAADRARFLNLRAEAYWRLRELLEAGAIAIPSDEKLADELLATTWKPDSSGRIRIETKDVLRSRLGRSPDRADAVVMAAWHWWIDWDGRQAYDSRKWRPFRK